MVCIRILMKQHFFSAMDLHQMCWFWILIKQHFFLLWICTENFFGTGPIKKLRLEDKNVWILRPDSSAFCSLGHAIWRSGGLPHLPEEVFLPCRIGWSLLGQVRYRYPWAYIATFSPCWLHTYLLRVCWISSYARNSVKKDWRPRNYVIYRIGT